MQIIQESRRRGSKTSIFDVDIRDDDSIRSFVESSWESRDMHRHGFERQWLTNLTQFRGDQYHIYDDTTGAMRRPPAPSYRVRLVCNFLMPSVRKLVSKAMKSRPTWTSIPATDDVEDLMVAWVGTRVLKSYWRKLNMDQKVVDMFFWMFTTGNVFMRIFWDTTKGEKLNFGEEDFRELPSKYRKAGRDLIGKIRVGDPEIEVVPPFEVEVDPNAVELEESSYVLHTKARSLDYLDGHYGKAAKGVKADAGDDGILGRYYQRKIQSMGSMGSGMMDKRRDEEEYAALCHQLWIAPSNKYPDGAYAVVAGGKVVKKLKKLPNPFPQIPYVHFKEIEVPGQFWGTCALEHAIPLQADYNRARSQIVEAANTMSKPKWLVPSSAGVAKMALTSEPGERITYNWPAKPEMISPPSLPEYIFKRMEYTLKDKEDGFAIHEVTQARAPSGVRSGVAISQLQEQDDQMLAPAFLLASVKLARLGGWLLHLMSVNATEERILKLVGETGEVETMAFVGKQLLGENDGRPGVDYYDVECQMSSQLSQSRAGKVQMLVDLWREGILRDDDERKRILKALDMGDEDMVIANDRLDRQAAMQENLAMVNGQGADVNPWDDDMIHLETLRRFQKQPEYQKYASPEMNQMFEMHAAAHAMNIMRLQQGGAPPDSMQPPSTPGAPPSGAGPSGGNGMATPAMPPQQ